MFTRKDAVVALAACTMLAAAGMAQAEQATTPSLTLTPSVVNLDDAASRGLLMGGLDKVGAGKTLDSAGINIYGWVEMGYTANLRNNAAASSRPAPFTQEVGNHLELNQIDLRIERQVDLKKFDVGGMVEFLFGTDSNYIKSNGVEYQTAGDDPGEVPQFEIPQMYLDFAIPVGNGLKLTVGKFASLLTQETIAPVSNMFYTHSYLFNLVNGTETGILASYSFNDEWSAKAGITRGWDQFTEDNNAAIDFTGQLGWTPNQKLSILLNTSVGPENADDSAHYRTVINPIISYKVTEKLTLTGDMLYIYDGGVSTDSGYGSAYGIAGYAGYALNEIFTLNGRAEWVKTYQDYNNVNRYELTGGVTITPFPKDPIGRNLKIRPEIRYDFSEDAIYSAGTTDTYKDNWTAGADVIFTF